MKIDQRLLTAKLTHVFVVSAELVLGLRVIFNLFQGDITNSFVRWVFATSDVLVQPLRGIYPTPQSTTGHVLDFVALLAMVLYALVGILVVSAAYRFPVPKAARK